MSSGSRIKKERALLFFLLSSKPESKGATPQPLNSGIDGLLFGTSYLKLGRDKSLPKKSGAASNYDFTVHILCGFQQSVTLSFYSHSDDDAYIYQLLFTFFVYGTHHRSNDRIMNG